MALRINHNISAMVGHRWMTINDRNLNKSLEKLSSGEKVNRAADGPATLIISEQMRAQVSGMKQAIENSETDISMVQTTEAALTEVTNILTNMRQLAIHAANEGANDENMLEADQLEFDNSIKTIDALTQNAAFGKKRLLDGSQGANGVGIGKGLEFVKAGPATRTSPVAGYDVRIEQLATKAAVEGSTALTQEMVSNGEELTVSEGGRTVSFTTKKEWTVEQALGKFKEALRANGLNVNVSQTEDGRLKLEHNDYGSEYTFTVSSATAGVLSKVSREMESATAGKDIIGTIGGEVAMGKGQILTGSEGTKVEGLVLRYQGDTVTAKDADADAPIAGRMAVYQNSLIFQIGANAGQTVSISMVNTNSRVMGRGVENQSGYRSLSDIDLRSSQGATDAQRLIDKAIDEVNVSRAHIGAFQKNNLEANLRQLRISMEELVNADSVIRDADMAQEVAQYTRNNIMMQSSAAMLAQANQAPKSVLALLS
ncbi:MAG: flagellin [Deltaproteobacteria bacterium]|nr:flagellin [Deltaproteobacteria bacterium]